MLNFPSIPEPKEDLKSLNASVLTLKRAVEMLTGQGRTEVQAAHVFVQSGTPTALSIGDLWVCLTAPATLNVWIGDTWVKIVDVGTTSAPPVVSGEAAPPVSPASAPVEVDLNVAMFTRRLHR
jgi:hypothetical protein